MTQENNITSKIVIEFSNLVLSNKEEFSLNDLKNMLSEVYKNNNKKEKREPSKYNLFMKEKMTSLKTEYPDLNARELMSKVGELWKIEKNNN